MCRVKREGADLTVQGTPPHCGMLTNSKRGLCVWTSFCKCFSIIFLGSHLCNVNKMADIANLDLQTFSATSKLKKFTAHEYFKMCNVQCHIVNSMICTCTPSRGTPVHTIYIYIPCMMQYYNVICAIAYY